MLVRAEKIYCRTYCDAGELYTAIVMLSLAGYLTQERKEVIQTGSWSCSLKGKKPVCFPVA